MRRSVAGARNERSADGGPGVRAKEPSAITLPNGHMQVTYAGHALYGYTGDTSPGETSYIGINAFGGLWYGVNARGKAVK
jgi:hypothetical protein